MPQSSNAMKAIAWPDKYENEDYNSITQNR